MVPVELAGSSGITGSLDGSLRARTHVYPTFPPGKKIKRRDVPRAPSGSPPPQPSPLPPSAGTSGAPGSKASSSSNSAASTPQSMAWTTSDTRYKLASLSGTQELSLTDSLIPDDSIPDEQAHLSEDEDSLE
nr:hypothetical protein [Tanacetum cinerariifolium]